MDAAQRDLARHALGLPNDRHRSYRNRYSANPTSRAFDLWCDMAEAGLAIGPEMVTGIGSARFALTDTGAKLALEFGETLCPEDFPSATQLVSA